VLHATTSATPRRELVLEGPALVQFNTGHGEYAPGGTARHTGDYSESYADGDLGGAGFEAGAFDEDDWNLGADLGRREPPSKEFRLRLRRGADAIWVEVFDSDMRLPRIRSAGETDEGGRGLYLVDQLASRWGARPTAAGKAVWFELPLTS
jgi:hypothetical protein